MFISTTKRTRFSTITALVIGITVIGVPVGAQQAVNWTNNQNVTVRGNSLEKTGGCQGCDDAGAVSQQMIRSGNGFGEFTVGEDYSFYVAGLSRRDGTTRFGDIDFGIRLNGNGWADIMENGAYAGGDTAYRAGDLFRVEVLDGRVRYLKNGRVMLVSQKRPVYPLALDVSLGSMGSTVRNARFDTRDTAVGTGGAVDEFNGLDRNRDRRVTRAEWRASGNRGNFNQLDLNRDGFISRAEFGRSNQDTVGRNTPGNDGANARDTYGWNDRAAVGTAGQFVAVSSTNRWTNTGIYVQAGDAISFDADGTIQMSTNRNDNATPAGSRRSATDAPVSNASAGSLIARIGNSAPFAVGANGRVARAPASGQLFLGVNDDYLADNSGGYRVMVTVAGR